MGEKRAAGKNSLEVRYQRYRGILRELTMMSDVFMRNVLKDRACTEYIFRTILEDGGPADSRGRQINIEVQQKMEGASPQRARYHSGLLDMNTLNPGQRFEELPESCVIFITLGDGLGYGCPICHIKRKISEVNQWLLIKQLFKQSPLLENRVIPTTPKGRRESFSAS